MTGQSLASDRVLPEVLSRWNGQIEGEMHRQALPPTTQLGRMASYHLGWVDVEGRSSAAGGGKRMRPALCLWAASACGADPQRALPVAAAIELVHNFTLVHDDIQDGDLLRRGRPTVWSIWGQAQGINVGDGLFALALRAALAQPEAARVLVDATVEVIEGQCLDLQQEGLLEELGGARATEAAPMEWAARAVAAVESCEFAGERMQEFVDVAHHVAERSR